MKCKNCGAEANGRFCEYCGSEMPHPENPHINVTNNYYYNNNPNFTTSPGGCSNCGSNNITSRRENTANWGYHQTVGICNNCGNTWIVSQDIPSSSRNKYVALFLCILFGFWGLHYFYVGKVGMGILYFFTMGLFGFGWIIDIIRIATGSFTDNRGIRLM